MSEFLWFIANGFVFVSAFVLIPLTVCFIGAELLWRKKHPKRVTQTETEEHLEICREADLLLSEATKVYDAAVKQAEAMKRDAVYDIWLGTSSVGKVRR